MSDLYPTQKITIYSSFFYIPPKAESCIFFRLIEIDRTSVFILTMETEESVFYTFIHYFSKFLFSIYLSKHIQFLQKSYALLSMDLLETILIRLDDNTSLLLEEE